MLRLERMRSRAVLPGGSVVDAPPPVSLEIGDGECVTLSGPSGVGKTLLLRAIADLDPNEGEAWLDGRPRSGMSGPAWRRQVVYVPSESAWWDERLRAHFPGRRVPHLEALGLSRELLARPVSRLSSGERQRFALARALSVTPRALLLDEPTSALDPASTRRVEALLGRLRREQGLAVLWVSHDARQARRVGDRRLRLTRRGLQAPVRRRARAAGAAAP